MRIGFFGGSFDPPHNGHLAVAEAAANAFSLDRVLLAPVAAQPLKSQPTSAGFSDRLAMVERLTEADPRFEASSLDAPRSNGEPNFTINTLTTLRETLAESDELYVIVGVDAFLDIPRWHSPERLLSVADWIVVSRPGLEFSLKALPIPPGREKHIHLLQGVEVPVSATEIRQRLSRGESCKDMLPAAVLEYIESRGLYASSGLQADV